MNISTEVCCVRTRASERMQTDTAQKLVGGGMWKRLAECELYSFKAHASVPAYCLLT